MPQEFLLGFCWTQVLALEWPLKEKDQKTIDFELGLKYHAAVDRLRAGIRADVDEGHNPLCIVVDIN